MANVRYKYDKDQLKPLLKNYLIEYHNINPRKNFHCLSPSHDDNNPSMSYYEKGNCCICFSCGAKYDIFDLVAQDYNIPPTKEFFRDKVNKVVELYPNLAEMDKNYTDQFKKYSKPEKLVDYTQYFNQCKVQIARTNYLQTRGISKQLEFKYGIGYDPQKDMVIFPVNKNSYFGRGIHSNRKENSKGSMGIWNAKVLDTNPKNIIVVEGIIDALSLEQAGCKVPVLAIMGVQNYKKLGQLLKDKNYNGRVFISLDNDQTGRYMGEVVSSYLTENCGFKNDHVFQFSFAGYDFKDINEELVATGKIDILEYFNQVIDNFEKKEKETNIEENHEKEVLNEK